MEPDNKYYALDCPPLIDIEQCTYRHMDLNPSYPEWTNGFMRFFRKAPGVTDWEFYDAKTDWKEALYSKANR